MSGIISGISGSVIRAEGLTDAVTFDLVRVGSEGLLGRVIGMTETQAYIRMYDHTAGLTVGESVTALSAPLTAELGPGLLSAVFDGMQRPLTGAQIPRGSSVNALDRTKRRQFVPAVRVGDVLRPGDTVGTVWETEAICHRISAPQGAEGVVVFVADGSLCAADPAAVLEDAAGRRHTLTMLREQPVHKPCSGVQKRLPTRPLFPKKPGAAAKGDVVALLCRSEDGKAALLRKIAAAAEADVVVWVGCAMPGDRLADLRQTLSDTALAARTVLIANTADMPPAVREVSVDTGLTIAEYYRDMGYDTLVILDDLSRWADALCVLAADRNEIPDEMGYPAGLGSRLLQCCARAGETVCLHGARQYGSVTVVGAVLPPVEDDGDPVVQAIMRAADVLWKEEEMP